jgi:hypothetical protein
MPIDVMVPPRRLGRLCRRAEPSISIMQSVTGSPITLFFLLAAGHAFGDFPLQNAFMAEAKNRHSDLGATRWTAVLPAHSLIHGAIVFLVTGSLVLGLAETVAHGAIDFARCEGRLGFGADQILHVACKVAWVALLLLAPGIVQIA